MEKYLDNWILYRTTAESLKREKILEKVIDSLSSMRVETPEGKTVDKVGDYIEPIYLQVVCDKLWKKLVLSERTEISPQFLEKLGNVDNALEELYVEAIREATSGKFVSQDLIRNWLEKKLITPNDTRESAYKDPLKREKIPEESLSALEKKYVIRVDRRPSGRWYQLTHDRLIKPIKKSNKERKDQLTRRNYLIIFVAIAIISSSIYTYYAWPKEQPSPPQAHTLGAKPSFIAVDDDGNTIYVSSSASKSKQDFRSNITVINSTANKIIDNIEVDYQPRNLEINPKTNKLYFSSANNSYISIVDLKSEKEDKEDEIELDYIPESIAVNPNRNEIYVSPLSISESNDEVLVFEDLNSLAERREQKERSIDVTSLSKIIVNPTTNETYILSSYNNSIAVIPDFAKKESATIDLKGGQIPQDISINPKTNTLYVESSDYPDEYLTLIDATSKQIKVNGSIVLPPGTSDVEVNPLTNTTYLLQSELIDDSFGNSYSILAQDLTTNETYSVPISISPTDIAVNPNTNTIYAFSYDDPTTLLIINGTTYDEQTIELDYKIEKILVDPDTNTTYLGAQDEFYNYFILPVNSATNQVVDPIPLSTIPDEIVVNPSTKTLYAFSNDYLNGTSISAIDATTKEVESTYPINGLTPNNIPIKGMAMNPNTNTIYAFDYLYSNGTNISVINGTTNQIMDIIQLKYEPWDISINPTTNIIYVHTVNRSDVSPSGYFPDYITLINGTTNQAIWNTSLQSFDYVMVDPNTNKLYAIKHDQLSDNNSLSITNISTNETKTVPISIYATDIAVNPNMDTIYAFADDEPDTLLVINGTYNEQPIDLDYEIKSILVDPRTNMTYIGALQPNSEKYFLMSLNGTTNQVTKTIPITAYPDRLNLNSDTNTIYVSEYYSDYPTFVDYGNNSTVSVISGTTFEEIDTIKLPYTLDGIVAGPNTNILYAINHELYSNSSISTIDTVTKSIKNIPLDQQSIESDIGPYVPPDFIGRSISVNPNTDTTYLSGGDNYLLTINGTTNEVIRSILVDPVLNESDNDPYIPPDFIPSYVFVDPLSNTTYTTGQDSVYNNYLLTINGTTNEVIDRIDSVSFPPKEIIMDPQSNRSFVLMDYDIGVLNRSDLELEYPFKLLSASNIVDLSFDNSNNRLFVAQELSTDSLSNSPLEGRYSISVFNTTTYEKLGSIQLETIQNLVAIHYDKKTDNVLVLDTKTGSISSYSADV